jgi:hypothetical protein
MFSKIKTAYLMFVGLLYALGESAYLSLTTYMARSGLIAHLNLYSQYTYDAALLLKAPALVAATADGSLILDVGVGLFDSDLVIDVTELDIASSDESYEILVMGSSDAAFGVGANIEPMASITIGDKASTRGAAGVIGIGTDDLVGRYVLPFRNERNGTTFRYLRIRTIVVGTIISGINYTAFAAKDD